MVCPATRFDLQVDSKQVFSTGKELVRPAYASYLETFEQHGRRVNRRPSSSLLVLVRSLIVEGSLSAMNKPVERSVSSLSGSVKPLAVLDSGAALRLRPKREWAILEHLSTHFVVVGSPPFVIEAATFM
jgi:hypothetical protein